MELGISVDVGGWCLDVSPSAFNSSPAPLFLKFPFDNSSSDATLSEQFGLSGPDAGWLMPSAGQSAIALAAAECSLTSVPKNGASLATPIATRCPADI